jgi:hypothetical protein
MSRLVEAAADGDLQAGSLLQSTSSMRTFPIIAVRLRSMAEWIGAPGNTAFSRCSRKESRCSVPISEIRLVHLQKPQYRTTRHDLSAPDRQVAIYDKAMQHKHPLISPFAERTMVTRWSLLNCLFRLGRLTLLVRSPTLEPPHGKALRAHIMLCRHA